MQQGAVGRGAEQELRAEGGCAPRAKPQLGNSITRLTVWLCPPVLGSLWIGAELVQTGIDPRLGLARL